MREHPLRPANLPDALVLRVPVVLDEAEQRLLQWPGEGVLLDPCIARLGQRRVRRGEKTAVRKGIGRHIDDAHDEAARFERHDTVA